MEKGRMQYDMDACTKCDACIYTCNRLSSPKLLSYSNTDILKDINKVKDFIRGVTFSGGEATLQYKAMTPLIKEIKAMGLSVFIDSNGNFESSKDFNDFIDLVDQFMIDIKFMDDKIHKENTGVSNALILDNVKDLYMRQKLYEVRTVLYDNEEYIEDAKKIVDFLPQDVLYKVIPYHRYGVRKEFVDAFKVPSKDTIKMFKQYLDANHKNYIII
jgi:pyruvate-formate lyase-activating enzyme